MLTFEEALARAEGKPRHLLLGNGFSATYFSSKNLFEVADFSRSEPIWKLFDQQGSPDFEQVILRLEQAAEVASAYGEYLLEVDFQYDADRVRAALVEAVHKSHPLRQQLPVTCDAFLGNFRSVFTLNYDLLLYYAAIDGGRRLSDGFGWCTRCGGFLGPFRPDAPCNTYNVHGGLHLFQTPTGEVEKRVRDGSGTLVDAISFTIRQEGRLPIYIAEGTTDQKLARINAVPYLRHCYEKLGTIEGALFVFGHSARNEDQHIYDAIFRSGADHIFFGVYEPGDLPWMRSQLARFKELNQSSVAVDFYASESARAWVSIFSDNPWLPPGARTLP